MQRMENQYYSEFNIENASKIALFQELGGVHLGYYTKEGTTPSNPIYDTLEYERRIKSNSYIINRTGEHIGVQMGAYKNQIPLDFQMDKPHYLRDLSFLDPSEYIKLFDYKCMEHLERGYFDHVPIEYMPGLTSITRRIFRIWFYVIYKRLVAFGTMLLPQQLVSPVTVYEYNMVMKEMLQNETEMERIKNNAVHYIDALRPYVSEMDRETEFGRMLLSEVLYVAHNRVERIKRSDKKTEPDTKGYERVISNDDSGSVKAIFI